MTTISIKLPEALATRLEAAARQRQKPKSGLARDQLPRQDSSRRREAEGDRDACARFSL